MQADGKGNVGHRFPSYQSPLFIAAIEKRPLIAG